MEGGNVLGGWEGSVTFFYCWLREDDIFVRFVLPSFELQPAFIVSHDFLGKGRYLKWVLMEGKDMEEGGNDLWVCDTFHFC